MVEYSFVACHIGEKDDNVHHVFSYENSAQKLSLVRPPSCVVVLF